MVLVDICVNTANRRRHLGSYLDTSLTRILQGNNRVLVAVCVSRARVRMCVCVCVCDLTQKVNNVSCKNSSLWFYTLQMYEMRERERARFCSFYNSMFS